MLGNVLRIGKNARRVAIFLGLGWGGEVIILLLGCGRAGIRFSVGMEQDGGSHIFRKNVFASMLSHAV